MQAMRILPRQMPQAGNAHPQRESIPVCSLLLQVGAARGTPPFCIGYCFSDSKLQIPRAVVGTSKGFTKKMLKRGKFIANRFKLSIHKLENF